MTEAAVTEIQLAAYMLAGDTYIRTVAHTHTLLFAMRINKIHFVNPFYDLKACSGLFKGVITLPSAA